MVHQDRRPLQLACQGWRSVGHSTVNPATHRPSPSHTHRHPLSLPAHADLVVGFQEYGNLPASLKASLGIAQQEAGAATSASATSSSAAVSTPLARVQARIAYWRSLLAPWWRGRGCGMGAHLRRMWGGSWCPHPAAWGGVRPRSVPHRPSMLSACGVRCLAAGGGCHGALPGGVGPGAPHPTPHRVPAGGGGLQPRLHLLRHPGVPRQVQVGLGFEP
jgi:hypothetical protein